jgi:hypothetical protein
MTRHNATLETTSTTRAVMRGDWVLILPSDEHVGVAGRTGKVGDFAEGPGNRLIVHLTDGDEVVVHADRVKVIEIG